MVKISQPLSDSLNLMRWIAAFMVVIGHLRSLIFINYDAVESKHIFTQVFYFMTSLGHEAVIVFFVLSGFLVGGKLWREISSGTFLWKRYLIKRMTRLYVVLVPALFIGGILDLLGSNFFNETHIYDNAFRLSSLGYDVVSRLNIEIFISNLCMMQETLTPTFGSNGPLWSLAYEFWYYILYPVLLILIIRRYNKIQLILYIILFAGLVFILHRNILIYFPIWILGAITFLYYPNNNSKIFSVTYSIN